MIYNKYLVAVMSALVSVICTSIFLIADMGMPNSTLLMSLHKPKPPKSDPVLPEVKVNDEQTLVEIVSPSDENPVEQPNSSLPDTDNPETTKPGESAIDLAHRVRREGGEYDNATLTFTLGWNDRNDLDLHVISPDGGEIWYSNKGVDGGVLDVDMNALYSLSRMLFGTDTGVSSSGNSNEPVENVSWSKDFPRGKYKVRVVYFANYGPETTDYTLQVRYGKTTKTVSGTVRQVKDQGEYEFDIP